VPKKTRVGKLVSKGRRQKKCTSSGGGTFQQYMLSEINCNKRAQKKNIKSGREGRGNEVPEKGRKKRKVMATGDFIVGGGEAGSLYIKGELKENGPQKGGKKTRKSEGKRRPSKEWGTKREEEGLEQGGVFGQQLESLGGGGRTPARSWSAGKNDGENVAKSALGGFRSQVKT